YKANGFRDVKVTSIVENDYEGKLNRMAITFAIDEGPQWLVESLDLTGVAAEHKDRVLAQLDSTKGEPYSDVNIAMNRTAIMTFYYTIGYPKATFESAATPSEVPNRIRLQ